jgi:biopolymer transport protein ExbD
MRRTRRPDWSPRIEIMPMIDVIFLLLTFFIYAMVTMVQAQVLPVRLTTLSTAEQAEPADYAAITIDRQGGKYLNREPIEDAALSRQLKQFAQQDEPPQLLLAMAAPNAASTQPESPRAATRPAVDRGPMLIQLIEQVREAGIEDFHIVGEPGT